MTSAWKRNLRTACRSGKCPRSAHKEQTEKHTPRGFNTAQRAKQTSKPRPTARHSLIARPERRNGNSCMQSTLLVRSRSPQHVAVCSALLPSGQEGCWPVGKAPRRAWLEFCFIANNLLVQRFYSSLRELRMGLYQFA